MQKQIIKYKALAPAQHVPRGRILLIDDDLGDLEYHFGILQGLGHEVVTCASHVQGVRLLERETFDLIMTSQGSIVPEGLSVLQRAIEIDRSIPVLVLTRCVAMDSYLEAMQLGAVDYLEKPVSPQDMARVVRNHLRPQAAA